MDSNKLQEIKQHFYSKLEKIISEKADNSGFLSRERYAKLKDDIKQLKENARKKTPQDYQKLKRYDLISEKLIYPLWDKNSPVLYYVIMDDLFDIIHEAHLATGHGGRNRMTKEINKKYKNVTAETVMIYLNLCEACQKKSKIPKKEMALTQPVAFKEINTQCQVDLIDMQTQEDKGFKFILVYQDQMSKLVQLRPLKTDTAEEVARQLLQIFTIFGAPSVLQSGRGREFANRIIEEVCGLWPELKMVHGEARRSESQEVQIMLSAWMETNPTSEWADALCFIQFKKNCAYHMGMKCTPHEAMFGAPVKLGLKCLQLPQEAIQCLRTEEELEQLIHKSDDLYETQFSVCTSEVYVKLEEVPDQSINLQD